MVTRVTSGELQDMRDAIRGELARCWPSARSACDGSVGAVQRMAEARGWLELWADDLLPAALVAAAELGRVACPLPVVDSFVAGRVLGREAGRTAVATGINLGMATRVEAGAVLSRLLLVPSGGGTARLRALAIDAALEAAEGGAPSRSRGRWRRSSAPS